MSIIHLVAVDGEEPTQAELAAIEREWPLMEAEQELLDAEIAFIRAGALATDLDRRRIRRAERRVQVVSRELAVELGDVDGLGAA